MGRAPGYENHPFDHAWWFYPSQIQGAQIVTPGFIRLADAPIGGRGVWDVLVKAFDPIAQKHMADRTVRPGQPIQMGDGRVLTVPYLLLDDEADAMLGRGMAPHPDRNPIDVPVRDQNGEVVLAHDGKPTVLKSAPRDWFENLARSHIQRRNSEPPVTLNLGTGPQGQPIQIVVTFAFFDALCKDFMRRRGDFVAAGWWPELLMKDYGQIRTPDGKSIAPPVDGRANALGHGVNVMDGQKPPQPQQQGGHPMADNDGVI